MVIAVGKRAIAGNFPPIVDIDGIVHDKTGTGKDERLQIRDGAVFPHESVVNRTLAGVVWIHLGTESAPADNLIAGIHAISRAGIVPSDDADIGNNAVLPEEGTVELLLIARWASFT